MQVLFLLMQPTPQGLNPRGQPRGFGQRELAERQDPSGQLITLFEPSLRWQFDSTGLMQGFVAFFGRQKPLHFAKFSEQSQSPVFSTQDLSPLTLQ